MTSVISWFSITITKTWLKLGRPADGVGTGVGAGVGVGVGAGVGAGVGVGVGVGAGVGVGVGVGEGLGDGVGADVLLRSASIPLKSPLSEVRINPIGPMIMRPTAPAISAYSTAVAPAEFSRPRIENAFALSCGRFVPINEVPEIETLCGGSSRRAQVR